MTDVRTAPPLAGLVLSLFAAAACGDTFEVLFAPEPRAGWRLPDALAEISALAMTKDERLFAVDDERAIVYQIDYRNGRLLKSFALGSTVARGDFEGLAVVGSRFFLMTSEAGLLIAAEGDDGERVPFEFVDTGFGEQCEFEGLTDADEGRSLWLLCKQVLKGADVDVVTLFEWRLDAQPMAPGRRIALPVDEIGGRIDERRLRPSGVTVHPLRKTFFAVAAREGALVEFGRDGKLRNAVLLPGKRRHEQTEGIAFAADGALILADEARGGPPRLTVYAERERYE